MEQPFYIGQEVVALKTGSDPYGVGVVKDQQYTILNIHDCKCGHSVDVGLKTQKAENCACGSLKHTTTLWVYSNHFAPIEKAKTKYVVKEVEVATTIRELEICKS